MEENNNDNIDDEKYSEGPLSLLKESVKTNNQILVYCRNNRKLLGKIRAFDRHMNMILETVTEIWTEMIKGKNKTKKLQNRTRTIPKLFLRGDSVILCVKNLNNTTYNKDNNKKNEKESKKNDKKENKENKEDKEDEKEINTNLK